MSAIGCPNCGYEVEIESLSSSGDGQAVCPHCSNRFALGEGLDLGAETAVLEKKSSKKGAMLDIALVGHLRVSGSMSLEAPSALKPGKTVVGREGADIVAADATLSARHFEIDNCNGEFFVTDLGSTNGTRLNGEDLTRTRRLENGDRIEAGKTTFVFRTLETVPWRRSE